MLPRFGEEQRDGAVKSDAEMSGGGGLPSSGYSTENEVKREKKSGRMLVISWS